MENRAFLRTTLLRSSARRSAAGQVAYRVVYSSRTMGSSLYDLAQQPMRSTEHYNSRDTVAHEQRLADCGCQYTCLVRLYIGAALGDAQHRTCLDSCKHAWRCRQLTR
jgi:hypothetical protein